MNVGAAFVTYQSNDDILRSEIMQTPVGAGLTALAPATERDQVRAYIEPATKRDQVRACIKPPTRFALKSNLFGTGVAGLEEHTDNRNPYERCVFFQFD